VNRRGQADAVGARGGARVPARLGHVSLTLKRQLWERRSAEVQQSHGPESAFMSPVRPGNQPKCPVLTSLPSVHTETEVLNV